MNSPILPKHIAALIIVIVTGVLAICATLVKSRSLEIRMENGCPGATSTMANRYWSGKGVAKDLKKSKELYEKLAKDGISGAADDLKKVTAELNLN